MPIYEYECTACGNHHEVIQKITEQPLVDCPSCQQPALKKLISAVGFRLSGTGWYETDFKQSNKRNLSGKEAKESKDAKDAKDSSKTDSPKSKESDSAKTGKSADTSKASTTSQSASSAG